MINIGLIPTVRKKYKNQIEVCVDLRLIQFLKKTFSEKKIQINYSINKKTNLIILTGGNDLSNIKKSLINVRRDKLNKKALNYSKSYNIPIVGYCGGAQYLAFKFGSKISLSNKHVGNHKLFVKKDIFSRNLKFPKNINSFHDYVIEKLGKNLVQVCFAKDKTTEFFFHKKKKVYGIMWHPERNKKFSKFDKILLRKISCI